MGAHREGVELKDTIRIMKFIRRHRRSILIAILLVIVLAPCGLVLWAGGEIASPSRRDLMDYHREYLANPWTHGMCIDSFTTSDGTPCLVCVPSGQAGERGLKIRQQLAGRGIVLPSFGEIRGTLVLCHGRKGRKEDYLSIAERLCATGFRCVIPDLPAHGEHPGRIATYGIREAALPAKVLDEASSRFSFPIQPCGLMGMSMGGSVAVHAASLPHSPWQALVVVSSFDSFPEVIAGQASRHAGSTMGPYWAAATGTVYRWKTGVSLDEIQPRRHTADIHIPTLIAHGTKDRVVPLASGRNLFDSLVNSPAKKWVEIPGADHDNVLVTNFPIYAEIAEWMLGNVTAR